MNRLAEIAARKVEIRGLLEADGKIEFEKIEAELKALEAEETELRKRLDMAKGIEAGTVEYRVVGSTKPDNTVPLDPHDTPEYRKAFMDYVTRGVKSEKLELRAVTEVGDIGAVIPTKILNMIVEKMETVGRIWRRVTKTSYQGGVQIPIATAKPVATWVAPGTMSPKQQKAVTGSIIFGYHKLQCRVAVELVAGTIAMPVFENTLSSNIAEAMVKALDLAVIDGTGTGQPLGIINQTGIPAARLVDLSVTEFGQYKPWAETIGKVPREYRGGSVLIMNDADWNTHIVGMVDNTGQPIARVTYGMDGTIVERLIGREVIPTDLLPSVDTAAVGEVIAVMVRLEDYLVNSNMAISFRRYFDEDTDEWVSKSTMIADGKLADTNGVVLIRKQA